jgi:hypothetical protein
MRRLLFLLIIGGFLGYLVFEGRTLIFPPPLKLFSPPENLETTEKNVEVIGQTEPGVKIVINGSSILPKENGYFQKTIVLQPGLNILEIKALKRYARPKILKRKILVNESTLSQKLKNN